MKEIFLKSKQVLKLKKKFLIVTTVSESLPFFKGQVNVLKEDFDVELVSSAGIQLEEMCSMHNVKGHALAMKRNIDLLFDLISLWKLIFLFSKIKPEVVHSNTPKAGLLATIAAWITRVPHRIYYVHGLRYHGESGLKRKILMKMEGISCFFATDILAVSNGVKRTLKNDNITKKQIRIIGNGSVNGIDIEYFNPDIVTDRDIVETYKINENDFVFGFIGRLVGDKGINELIKSFKRIDKIFNAKLLLIGTFEHELDPLEDETLHEIKSNHDIFQIGFKKDVRPFLKAMDVFVFPSYREGFGIVLIEAAAMGVPSISSNIIGCNEIVIDGENGYLIQSRDERSLYERMEFCVQNQEIIKQMSSNTRINIVNDFEQKTHWAKSLKVYKEITQQK